MSVDTVEVLRWDSDHFGFPIGRVTQARPDAGELRRALASARHRGLRLVYWLALVGEPPQDLVAEFSGARVSGHVTYGRSLIADSVDTGADTAELYDGAPEEPSLRELAVAAGKFSRFRLDARLDPAKFVEMYEAWMDKSVRGELADRVLVTREDGADVIAVVTYARTAERSANIGLVAVAEPHHGKGLGYRLMQATHAQMVADGIEDVTITTQTENRAACRLYEKAGYEPLSTGDYYHFWLGDP